MLRYLTAPKIGYLVLLSIYVQSKVPHSSVIPVLSFLLASLVHRQSSSEDISIQSLFTPIENFRDILNTLPSLVPGRTLWDIFLQNLWTIEDFDRLHEFFARASASVGRSREDLLEEAEDGHPTVADPNQLSRNSPFGVFVRRSCLEFTRLQFHDGISLWQEIIAWREPSYTEWRKRNTSARPFGVSQTGIDKSKILISRLYNGLESKISEQPEASAEDADRLMSLQVEHMQRTGQRVPRDVQKAMEQMLRSSSITSSLMHYSKFLDAWKAADYTTAFDNLHRYFDYTMNVSGRSYYHYALLNMAFLYADFGCYREAVAAMHESITMARENKDMSCLNFSLSWLYDFSKEHPSETEEVKKNGVLGTDKEALAFIRSKARESGSWSLLSTTLLAESKLVVTNGESMASAFENVARAQHLNLTKNVGIAISHQVAVETSLYHRLGLHYMHWIVGEIHQQCFTSEASLQDTLNGVCRRAVRLARRGRYSEAVTALESVDPETLRIVKRTQMWVSTMASIKLQCAMRRDDRTATTHFLAQAKAHAWNSGRVDITTSLIEVEFELRRGETSTAYTLVDGLLRKVNTTDGDIYEKLLLMVMKARVLDKAGVPQKGFSLAIRAASIAYSARILNVLYHAIGALCRILISIKEFAAAAKLLTSIMPQILECEDCQLAANSFSVLADAHIGMAGLAGPGSPRRKENMTKALEFLQRAFDDYARLEDVIAQCEMLAKRAMIMRVNGDLVLANDTAAKAQAIREAAARGAEVN